MEYETAGSPDGFRSTEVVTLPPPPDYEPPPAGPKDIRVSATHNTITVSWRASREDSAYVVDVYPAGTSARAHIADLPPGTTTVTADGNALPIQPDTLYEVVVFELGIPSVTERVMIRTALSPAQSAPPLTMILTAERSECTAGTLNPVTWTITGGTAPYTLTVAGETVDADAESAAVTCGALPDYGIWLPVTQAPGTITATVTDASRRSGDGQRGLHDRAAAPGASGAGGPRAAYAHAGPVGRCARARLRAERDGRLPLPLISAALAGR